ncbi:MAG: hypothetical protein KF852_00195 [Saprospiraceae bacterium]|nr:hypothetical protein [Saprospiraceae bacterium]
MRIIFFSVGLLCVSSLFSQKHDIDLPVIKEDDKGIMRIKSAGGLLKVLGVEGKGVFFYYSHHRTGTPTQFSFLSNDGSKTWKSGDIEFNCGEDIDVFTTGNRNTLYCRSAVKGEVRVLQLNEEGKQLFNAVVKYAYPVLSYFESQGKIYAICHETTRKDAGKMYLQEVSAEGFQPQGTAKEVQLPVADVKKWNFPRWIYGGCDDNRMLFFRKSNWIIKGTAQYHIAFTDKEGRLIKDFFIELGADKRFIYPVKNANAFQRYTLLGSVDTYKVVTSPQDGRVIRGGPAEYSDLVLDWKNNRIYVFGDLGSQTEVGITMKSSEGWFVRQYDFEGNKLWEKDGRYSKNEKNADPPVYLPRGSANRVTLSADGKQVLLRNTKAFNAVLTQGGESITIHKTPASSAKKVFVGTGPVVSDHNESILSWFHVEIMDNPVLESAFGEKAGSALKSHLIKNGNPTSWYIIQKHTGTFSVLQFDTAVQSYSVWTAPH